MKNRCVLIEVDYKPPERRVRKASTPTCRFRVICPSQEMQKRADLIAILDPRLTEAEIIVAVEKLFGRPLCPHCGKPLVKDGTNGSGTPQYRCKSCRKKVVFHATFEANIARYIKILTALTLVVHIQASVEDVAEFLGLSRNVLWEALWHLPDIPYKTDGKPRLIHYRKEIIAVVNLDGLYRGDHELLLTVSGERKILKEGCEKTGEGLPQLLDETLKGVEADRYLFITDANRTVAKWLVERYGEKAIVVMQNHTLWGDVMTYFHQEGRWRTLRLRTDAFTAATPKRRESELLPPGMIEFYNGFKGVNPKFTLRDYSTGYLEKWGLRLLDELRHLAWETQMRGNLEGLFLTMFERARKLNSIIKELRRRGETAVEEETRRVMDEIAKRYARIPGAKRKKLLMNAWKHLDAMPGEVEELGKALLGSWSMSEKAKKRKSGKRRTRDSGLRAVLVYRGPLQGWEEASLSREEKQALGWILGLLREVFEGREITNNICEADFSATEVGVRKRRSMFVSRAISLVYLRRKGIEAAARIIASHFPMDLMGLEAPHRGRVHLRGGGTYFIVYRNRFREVSFRTVTVLGRVKGMIAAFCHLKQERKYFIRPRILHAEPI